MDKTQIIITIITSTVTLLMGWTANRFQIFEKKKSVEQESYASELEAGARMRDRLMERNERLQEEVDELRTDLATTRTGLAVLRAEYQILKMELEERMRTIHPAPRETLHRANAVLLRHSSSEGQALEGGDDL